MKIYILAFLLLFLIAGNVAVELPASSPVTDGQQNLTRNKPRIVNIVLKSTDGGQTWQDVSQGLPETVQVEDFFVGKSDLYARANNLIYRSKSNLKTLAWEKVNGPDRKAVSIFNRYKFTEKGKTWEKVENEGLIMNVVESEGVLIGTGQKGIMRSTDHGEHWEWVISEGGVGIAIERIDGGFAAITYSATTKSRRVRISLDGGETWKAIDEGLPPSPLISSIKQMGNYLLCGHPDGIYRSSDMGKTWNMVHSNFDINRPWSIDGTVGQKVYAIYVSGDVVYAMARNAGC
jgi:photosystem II stability/assembly factor-like uncharacterized protein